MSTTQNTVSEKILNRIKKLIKSQQSFADMGSIEEANTFAGKIQDLLGEYNLSLGDISLEDRQNDVVQDRMEHTIPSVGGYVFIDIMTAIAKHNFCRVYKHWDIKSKERLIIIGSPENIEICKYILSTIMPIFKRVGNETYKKIKKEGYTKGLDTFLRSYYTGCRVGLDKKLTAEKEVSIKNSGQLAGLVKVNDAALVNFINEKWGGIKKGSKKSIGSAAAFGVGIKTGKNVQINKGVSGSKPISRKLLN